MYNNAQHSRGEPSSPSPPRDYHAYHNRESSARLSTTVVHALADAMDRDVTATGAPLYDAVDPDALDRIFAPTADGTPRPPGHVAFTANGYRVTVYSTGQIVITPPTGPPRSYANEP